MINPNYSKPEDDALSQYTVVMVDDELNILQTLKRCFSREKYRIICTNSGAEGLRVVENTANIAVIVSDQRMPGMDGSEFLTRSREFAPDATRILLTGYSDIETTVAAMNEGGATHYIGKPWEETILLQTVRGCVIQYHLNMENRRQTIELSRAKADLMDAHRESERSNKLLNAILENMNDWAWEVDAEGRYTFCSLHMVECLGYSQDEIIGKTPFSFMPPAEVEKIAPLFTEAYRLKLPIQNIENWYVSKDGRLRLLVTNAAPIIDECGNLVGYHGVDRDITNLRNAETELRKLSRAVTQSPVATVITDLDGTIEYVNPTFCELTGYSSEEIIGQNPRILNSGHTPQETFKSMWAALSEGVTWEGEFHNQSKHGQQFWEHAVISALRDESGTITHYLAVKEDITEKKALLEQLNSAKTKADSANAAKSEFLANMSHEIRTPMNGVVSMSSLLLETDLSAEQRDFAEIVSKSGENLLILINDILDFSKIEAGKLDLDLAYFDLRLLLGDIVRLLAYRADDAGLVLTYNIETGIPNILKGDPGRIRQIITNLIGNALKFTKQGAVVVNASLVSDQNGLVTIRFAISDTGIGIPESRLSAIFAPFIQVDASTTRKIRRHRTGTDHLQATGRAYGWRNRCYQ